jgi:hypothetical protein
MTTTHQLTRTDARRERLSGLTIHVAGPGVFVVIRGSRELHRGTFEQCYDYVSAALEGPRKGLTC